jgi:hypothetical protein
MYECTVTIDGEEQSSFFGVHNSANAMEHAVFSLAYFAWCKNRDVSHLTELELLRQVPEISSDDVDTCSITLSARIQEAISEVRAKVSAREAAREMQMLDEGWVESV